MGKTADAIKCKVIAFFIIVTMLSASAIAKERHQPSGQPFQKQQEQIDVLNKCRQPVLERLQVVLLREVSARVPVGDILGVSLVNREVQEAFLGRYLDREGSLEEFWENLGEDPSFTEGVLYELRLALFLGRVTYFNAPLLLVLKERRQAEGFLTLRAIANLTRETWRELLVESRADLDPELFIQDVDRTFDELLFGGCNLNFRF